MPLEVVRDNILYRLIHKCAIIEGKLMHTWEFGNLKYYYVEESKEKRTSHVTSSHMELEVPITG